MMNNDNNHTKQKGPTDMPNATVKPAWIIADIAITLTLAGTAIYLRLNNHCHQKNTTSMITHLANNIECDRKSAENSIELISLLIAGVAYIAARWTFCPSRLCEKMANCDNKAPNEDQLQARLEFG